eukprot:37028_1
MCNKLGGVFCQYQSIRFITVRNKKLVIVYYLIVFVVLLYIIGYTIIANKGYQASSDLVGATSVKLKGSGSIGNGSSLSPLDAMDLVVPSNELDAFFLTTALITTRNQTQTTCDGDAKTPLCTSADASNCTEDDFSWSSQGIYTGNCGSNNRCELFTWCPLEDGSVVDIVDNVGNFTVFVKVQVSFNRFGVRRTNTYDVTGDGSAVYGLNLFIVNEMLEAATDGAVSDYKDVATTGAILLVSSQWNCNFDRSVDECNPVFSFERVDDLDNSISKGFNFRTVTYDVNKQYRLLEKLYGIRVMFITEGTGSKFNLAALTVTLGAGLAYLSIAKVITDLILDNFMGSHSEKYSSFKYHEIVDNEAYDGNDTTLVQPQDTNAPQYQAFDP